MPTLDYRRTVDAPASIVWDVITDHELYAEAAPNLRRVEVLEGEGESMVRRCVDTNANEWTETCTHWTPGERFSVSVDVGESDFHRNLFSRFEGEWGLDETADGSEVVISFDFEPKYGPLGVFISKYFEFKAPDVIEAIFDRWEAEIETRTRRLQSSEPPTNPDGRNINALYP